MSRYNRNEVLGLSGGYAHLTVLWVRGRWRAERFIRRPVRRPSITLEMAGFPDPGARQIREFPNPLAGDGASGYMILGRCLR